MVQLFTGCGGDTEDARKFVDDVIAACADGREVQSITVAYAGYSPTGLFELVCVVVFAWSEEVLP